MFAFRIAKSKYVEDLSGEGARIYGGRWNQKGTSAVYLSENRALATVEYLVHISLAVMPADLRIAEIFIPDDSETHEVQIETLPEDWATYPPPSALKEIGEDWIRRNNALLMRAPSAVVRGEYNLLMNPKHDQARNVTIVSIDPMEIDERLRK